MAARKKGKKITAAMQESGKMPLEGQIFPIEQ